MDLCIFQVTVFIKRAKYEWNTALYSSLRVFNMQGEHRDTQRGHVYASYVLIGIHVFLGRSHRNTNTVFRLINAVCDMDLCIFQVTVFIEQAKYE